MNAEQSNRKSLLVRYRIPLIIVIMTGALVVINGMTTITAERLIPKFASSAQSVLGRNIAFLGAGLLLLWFVVSPQFRWKIKGIVLGALALIAGLVLASIREIENTGNNNWVVHFRWEKTQDQRLADFQVKSSNRSTSVSFSLDPEAPRFTDFLGPNRNGIADGPELEPDLKSHNPVELWRRPAGGGYAGFAIAGGLAVTIEQRGDAEVVAALDLRNGSDVWTREYPGHFQEALGGNGPRATPTIADNQVFALGADGLLVALDLATGDQKWETNILADARAKNIQWGMSGSPLVTADKVIVNPGIDKDNPADSSIIAYDRDSGAKVWSTGSQSAGYSSPMLVTLFETQQVLIFDAVGVTSLRLDDGNQLWRFDFPTFNGINVGQPLVLPGNQVFLSAGYDSGAVLVEIGRDGDQWSTNELWRNKSMKCKMGSCVFYQGHIYGLDDGIMACLDSSTGKRKWKGGRYGHGQFLLRGNLLVIQCESGDLALVAADPTKHLELSRVPALPNGKTWNAPSLAGDLLLLRNHFEATLWQMPTVATNTP